MFILVQPMYSKQELNADSNYVVYTALIRAMREVRPAWHWIVIFPDKDSGYKYAADGFFQLPNVTRLPQRISPRKFGNAIAFDAVWYDALMRKIGIDIVWCNLVESSAHIKYSGEAPFELKSRPVTIAAHNYVIHESLPYNFERMQLAAWLQVAGALFSDYNVFNSDHCRQMWVETARHWIKEELIAEALAKSEKINYGTLETALEFAPTENEIPVIAYNHRLQQYKNYDETFNLLKELYDEGIKFHVRYMNNTSENANRIAALPFVEIRLCATRADYLAALRGCDLNVTNSQHETFCISAIESMALGQPLVAPDGVTFPEITGRDDIHYPYLFKTREEQKDMLRKLLTDREERQKWGHALSDYVRANYNAKLWAERYAALFERLTAFELGTPEDARQMVAAKIREGDGQTCRELYNRIAQVSVGGRVPFSSQSRR